MSSGDLLLAFLLLGALAFQVWLTVRVWRNRFYERGEKLLQSKLIWLLPVIGAVLVYSLMPEEEEPRRPDSNGLSS
jgi:hypothetical protein